MIDNRLGFGHYPRHNMEVGIQPRQNVFHAIVNKDVQVFSDKTLFSQMYEQMPIPLGIDQSIQIPEWLDIFFTEYKVPLCKAEYINIWDPVKAEYIDFAKLRSYPFVNLRNASPIHIRYFPLAEIAVPPHPNFQSFINEKYEDQIGYEIYPNAVAFKEHPYAYQQPPIQTTPMGIISRNLPSKGVSLFFNGITQMNQDKTENPNNFINYQVPPQMHDDLAFRLNQHPQYLQNPVTQNISNVKLEDPGFEYLNLGNNLKKEDREELLPQQQKNNISQADTKYSTVKHKSSDSPSLRALLQGDQQNSGSKQMTREKRVKERKISYVKGKVDEWRNLYENGRTNLRNENEKVNLDSAASLVGLSRKTLDDYYAQLRKAELYGFDFDQNASEKMGTLRKFVKKMSESGINPNGDEPGDSGNKVYFKSNFTTPQLKPQQHPEIEGYDISRSAGIKISNRKYSENTFDLLQHSASFLPVRQDQGNRSNIQSSSVFPELSLNSISVITPGQLAKMKEETNNLFRIIPQNNEVNNLSNRLNVALNFSEDNQDKNRNSSSVQQERQAKAIVKNPENKINEELRFNPSEPLVEGMDEEEDDSVNYISSEFQQALAKQESFKNEIVPEANQYN